MLLDNNTKKVIELIGMFDDLKKIDKIRLAIYLLENKNFDINFNVKDIIILLKEVLNKLDLNYSKTIENFAKYKHLLFLSAKYLELTDIEKKKFTIEMLFNIFSVSSCTKLSEFCLIAILWLLMEIIIPLSLLFSVLLKYINSLASPLLKGLYMVILLLIK